MEPLYYLLANSYGHNTLFQVICILLCVVIPYLLGSINPAIIFSKLFYHDDIRTHGSGNAGTTNTLRTYGKKMSVLVLFCDMLKAAISVGVGALLYGYYVGGAIAGFFAIFGHMFPIYYKFRGGKGVACTAVVVLMMSPISFLVCMAAFLVIVIGTKFVSLGSVIAVALYPLMVNAFVPMARRGWVLLTSILIMAFVIFMHRKNLVRIYHGEESKLSFGKKDKEVQPAEPVPEKEYTDADFVKCKGCGHTIPVVREYCVYCNTRNSAYDPSKKK